MNAKCNNTDCEYNHNDEDWGCKHEQFKEQMEMGAGVSCSKYTRAFNCMDVIDYYVPAWRSR
jgi:hypothetical protein